MYGALGTFNYANGFATQWIQLIFPETASPEVVFGSLITTGILQLLATTLLFRNDVTSYFFWRKAEKNLVGLIE